LVIFEIKKRSFHFKIKILTEGGRKNISQWSNKLGNLNLLLNMRAFRTWSFEPVDHPAGLYQSKDQRFMYSAAHMMAKKKIKSQLNYC